MNNFKEYTDEIVSKALNTWDFRDLPVNEQMAFLSELKDRMMKDKIFFMKVRALYRKEFVDLPPIPKTTTDEVTKIFTD